MPTAEFIRALPKAELHLHFEGAVPWAMVRAHAADGLPERPAWWAEDFRFDDFTQFREASQACLSCLVDPPAYAAAAAVIFHGLRAQNVRYVEVSLDAVRVAAQRPPLDEVVTAVKATAPAGLTVRVIAAFAYHKAERTPAQLIDAVLTSPVVDGIDLHGDETRASTARFAAVFAAARARGLITKAHAGELVGPPSVARALDLLGVRRIEHGVRAIEDGALVERLARESITLDMCPWSNVKLRVVPELGCHPLARLHALGVPVTVSTDDPTLFGHSLTDELTALLVGGALEPADVARMQANAFRVAMLPGEAREAALREIDAVVARQAPPKGVESGEARRSG
jgi:adenosine deaminase